MRKKHVVTGGAIRCRIAGCSGDMLCPPLKIHGGGGCASKNYIGMYGMQAAKLQHDKG